MPFQSRVFSVLAVLPVVIWVGRCSRWSEAAYREAAAQAAREELAERRRIAAEPHLKEAQRPMPAVRGPYCRPEIASKPPFPKIEVEKRVYDFGTLFVGDRRRHTFHIKNVGTAPLILKNGPAGCKSWVPPFECELAIGATVEYEMDWKGCEVTRNFAMYRILFTNDPSQPEIQLKVYGQVKDPKSQCGYCPGIGRPGGGGGGWCQSQAD
jgi:Protein of unknown function (DUF1573)